MAAAELAAELPAVWHICHQATVEWATPVESPVIVL